jgi:hypothetical protein
VLTASVIRAISAAFPTAALPDTIVISNQNCTETEALMMEVVRSSETLVNIY